MLYQFLKIAITVGLIIAVSEIARGKTVIAAILASLPLTSVLAMTWLWWETGDAVQTSKLARDILVMVLPSLTLFIVFPWLIEARRWSFPPAMILSCLLTGVTYLITMKLIRPQ